MNDESGDDNRDELTGIWENTGSILCISNELGRSETGTLWNARTKGNRC